MNNCLRYINLVKDHFLFKTIANRIWIIIPWWRHQMETLSALLAICVENSPVPGEFPTQRPVTRSFDVVFDQRPNKRLSKQSRGWWFETPSRPFWRHRNAQGKRWIHVTLNPKDNQLPGLNMLCINIMEYNPKHPKVKLDILPDLSTQIRQKFNRQFKMLIRVVTVGIMCSLKKSNYKNDELVCKESTAGPRFNMQMTFYLYRKSHCGDKAILRPSYLHNGFSILVRWHLYIELGPRLTNFGRDICVESALGPQIIVLWRTLWLHSDQDLYEKLYEKIK